MLKFLRSESLRQAEELQKTEGAQQKSRIKQAEMLP